jgi:hypothetical protein
MARAAGPKRAAKPTKGKRGQAAGKTQQAGPAGRAPGRKRPGRKPAEIDIDKLRQLAADGLTLAEAAASLGIGSATLSRHMAKNDKIDAAIKEGRHLADAEVTNRLMALIRAENLGAVIWWEKTRKGYSERISLEGLDIDGAIERELAKLAGAGQIGAAGAAAPAGGAAGAGAGQAGQPAAGAANLGAGGG